ncbi:ACT domain-containing protein [Prauserella flavalba]|uniref:ACT domain-containing protein n=1 Tax=Prauserella flavalba TaxID=1477506 RepID=A0A318LTQ7_9PSEU|nr:ACT domain-containing protein [Prauserella flavalba]PXY26377.1 hypothetical protein BA062_24870 [Prauserella flavalba]
MTRVDSERGTTTEDAFVRQRLGMHVAGFDGVLRVISLLHQRRYAVRSLRMEPTGVQTWMLHLVVDTTPPDATTNLLVKRLNRLPSTLKVRPKATKAISSIWD